MGAFREANIDIFNDLDLSFDITVNRKSGEASFDQDINSSTFGQVIKPTEDILTRRVNIQAYSVNDMKDGMVAQYIAKGFKINNLLYMASLDEIIIGDTLTYLGYIYEVMESLPVTAGGGANNSYEIVYYDCLIAKKENQNV